MLIAFKLGARNLLRNRWRSGLTLAAVAVSVALMVWTLAMYDGWLAEMVRGATAVNVGQVQVHTRAYVETPRVYESYPVDAALLERVAGVPGVVAVSPRVKAYGLVGNEQRSQVAQLVGVDPAREAAATPVARAVVSGHWLQAGETEPDHARPVVIGEGLARQLGVSPGAELVVFAEAADGSLGNDLLRVVGVVRTGNTQVDRLNVFMGLGDAQYLLALDGRVNELLIRGSDMGAARVLADSVERVLSQPELAVQPWQEIEPGIQQMIVLFHRSYWFLYLLVYLVAAVGILNTARMSALERRREFGVLLAIGMRPRRMFRTIVAETLLLGLAGSVIGAGAGLLLSWYYARAGFDLGIFTSQAMFSYMGVAFSRRVLFVLSVRNVLEPIAVMLLVTMVSALWPAVRAARIDPAPTIAGRT